MKSKKKFPNGIPPGGGGGVLPALIVTVTEFETKLLCSSVKVIV